MSDNNTSTIEKVFDKNEEIQRAKKELEDIDKDLQEINAKQSRLKTVITENGGELHEATQQLKDKLLENERSLKQKLEINTQLQSQVDAISNSTWPLQLHYLANKDNKVLPSVIKLAGFKKYEEGESCDLITCYDTIDRTYQMVVEIYPNYHNKYVKVGVSLTKNGQNVFASLEVKILNQLSDTNHFTKQFDYFGAKYVWYDNFFQRKRLSVNAEENTQYLKDDCVFFKVCNFTLA